MGVYRDLLLPRMQNKVMDRKDLREVRSRVCSALSGDVVEVGFGTGLNAPHYPDGIQRIAAVEPSALCLRIAQPRITATSVKVELAGLTGEKLDLPSGEFDAALSTWTLCTIPDVDAALAEIRRVLKPSGTFHFVEHGRGPDPLAVAGRTGLEARGRWLPCHQRHLRTRRAGRLPHRRCADLQHERGAEDLWLYLRRGRNNGLRAVPHRLRYPAISGPRLEHPSATPPQPSLAGKACRSVPTTVRDSNIDLRPAVATHV